MCLLAGGRVGYERHYCFNRRRRSKLYECSMRRGRSKIENFCSDFQASQSEESNSGRSKLMKMLTKLMKIP